MTKSLSYLMGPLKRLFDFNGRSGRKEYWLYVLWLIPVWAAAVFIVITSCLAVCAALYEPSAQEGCGWTGVVISIILTWVGVPVMLMSARARRLHDLNMSGWWQLLSLIPYLGTLAVCILMCLPGTAGKNRFGPPPL